MKFLLALLPFALFAGDQKFGGDSPKRHKEVQAHFAKPVEPPTIWDRKMLTGSWGDIRKKLAKRGVTITSTMVNDMAGNVAGGRNRGFRQFNSWAADLLVDFGQMFGWTGFSLYTSSCLKSGQNLSDDVIDNDFEVQQVATDLTNFAFSALYLQQALWDDRVILRAGRLTMADTFVNSWIYGKFMSGAINGTPTNFFFNGVFTSFPNATWGAYMFVEPVERFDVKLGVYNANSDIGKNKFHGANFTFKSTEGALLMGQVGYHLGGKKGDTAWPGNYSAGAYYFTGSRNKLTTGTEKGNWGFYLMADQMIYREEKDIGLTIFGNFNMDPRTEVAKMPVYFEGGFIYRGLFPNRKRDTTATAIYYGTYSDKLPSKQSYECALEFNHWFWINEWWYMMPNLQVIINPKGLDKYSDAIVFGTEVGLTF